MTKIWGIRRFKWKFPSSSTNFITQQIVGRTRQSITYCCDVSRNEQRSTIQDSIRTWLTIIVQKEIANVYSLYFLIYPNQSVLSSIFLFIHVFFPF